MFRIGDRVIHAKHAFGYVVEGEQTTVKLDNGDIVTAPPEEWHPVVITDQCVLDVESLTDQQLDEMLARYRTMRVEGYAKRKSAPTKSKTERATKEIDDTATQIALIRQLAARGNEQAMALLKEYKL